MANKKALVMIVGICAAALFLLAGCNSTSPKTSSAENIQPDFQQADLQRATEMQLVEQMARYRNSYQVQLGKLIAFYDRQGNNLKSLWARQELDHLRFGPKRSYLVVAEVAGPDLRAGKTIELADQLYQEGLILHQQGRGKLGGVFQDRKKLYLALDKFNDLISKYSASDKIDDAAFQIAEIYNHCLKDYRTAMLYYQRVWQWDTQTVLPAKFAVAKMYDEKLRDHVKAVDYYQQVINSDTSRTEHVTYAQNRIKAIRKKTSR